jgi:hypothetical protein
VSYTEAKLLADTFQKVRDLTRWYLSSLKGADPYVRHELDGVKLNSLAWLAGHIVWAENFLVFKGTGGEGVDIPWIDHYKISSDGTLHEKEPNMKEIIDCMKLVHEKATAHLLTVTDEQMDAANPFGFGFGGITTQRIMVQHAIRHEAMHTGHLSWLCTINKLKMV